MQRLVVCLDGTWNTQDDTTNVWRIHSLVESRDARGISQQKYYDQGVGTRWYDRITGGAFGAGMYTDIRQAYNWISERYQLGDEVFIFGFSRGAATALSLANLIDRCGIVRPETDSTFEDAYRLYRMKGVQRETPASRQFRALSANDTEEGAIKFLGLFDAVASLYLQSLTGENMHVLTLPDSAALVSHAIALDENRRLFQSIRFPAAPRLGELRERWFSGAHANVGGGYSFDPLAKAPLGWMLRQAEGQGLAFRSFPVVCSAELLSTLPRNSHEEFAYGIPALCLNLFRKRRQIRRMATGNASEWIDDSAVERYLHFRSYRKSCIALNSRIDDINKLQRGALNAKNLDV